MRLIQHLTFTTSGHKLLRKKPAIPIDRGERNRSFCMTCSLSSRSEGRLVSMLGLCTCSLIPESPEPYVKNFSWQILDISGGTPLDIGASGNLTNGLSFKPYNGKLGENQKVMNVPRNTRDAVDFNSQYIS